jgi:hypothetical protein
MAEVDYDTMNEEIERLKNELLMARVCQEGTGSLLLDVQNDCIWEKNRADRAEKVIEDAKKALFNKSGYSDYKISVWSEDFNNLTDCARIINSY